MSYIGNTPFTAAFLTDTFSGNGSTVAFTMTVAPANTSSILVAVTGVVQDPSTYSVSGTTLTFSAAPPTGTSNISVRYLGIPASGVTTTAYRTQTEFTATAGQTTFTVPSYTVGYIDVYRNGLLLGSTDFTATTGTTVVLANAASAGDFIEAVSFYVSSVLNAIPATAGSVGTTYIANGVTVNFADGSASTPSITNDGDTNTGIFFPAADTIAFAEGGVEAMRLDANGNLGVGTTTPDVFGTGYERNVSAVGTGTTAAINVSGATASRIQLGVGSTRYGYIYQDASNFMQIATTTALPIAFNINGSERARIDSSGRLFVGYGGSAIGYPAGAVGAVGYVTKKGTSNGLNASGNCFNISWADGLTGAHLWIDSSDLGQITVSSDYRIKKNIETQSAAAIDRVMALRAVTYELADYGTLFKADGIQREGFIAHELQEVIPSAVEGEKDAENQIQSLKLDALCSVLTKAIQEQQAIIEQLQADVAALKGQA